MFSGCCYTVSYILLHDPVPIGYSYDCPPSCPFVIRVVCVFVLFVCPFIMFHCPLLFRTYCILLSISSGTMCIQLYCLRVLMFVLMNSSKTSFQGNLLGVVRVAEPYIWLWAIQRLQNLSKVRRVVTWSAAKVVKNQGKSLCFNLFEDDSSSSSSEYALALTLGDNGNREQGSEEQSCLNMHSNIGNVRGDRTVDLSDDWRSQNRRPNSQKWSN